MTQFSITKSKIIFSLIAFYFIFLNFAPITQAAGLVSCSGVNCTFCDLLKTSSNVFDFAVKIVMSLVVIMIIYGGFVIMTAGDSVDKVAQGRKIIQSSIIGVVIVLGAWLIISQVLAAIAKPGYKFEPSKIFTTGIKCS
ncbi:MAG: pilin [Patescibacteria group bacterium]